MEIYSKASKGLGIVDTRFLQKGILPQKIMPSKMEVASQHCDIVPNKTKDILDTAKIERIFLT